MDIKISDWVKLVDKELESGGMPMAKHFLISIKEQTIKLVEERGFAYDILGDRIVRD